MLLQRIAHMAQGRSHVERAARLTLGKNVIAAQVHLSSFACRVQLLEMAVAKLALRIPFVADGLRVGDAFGNCGRCGLCGSIVRG